MVLIESSKVWRFLSGLHPDLAGLADTGRDSLESYTDPIGCAISQEAWMKTKKKVIPNTDEGYNETTRVNQFHMQGNQHGGGKFVSTKEA